MPSLPRLSGSGMAWPVRESEAELVLVSHQLRRSGGWRPWLCLQVGEAANAISVKGYYNAVKPTVAGEELLGDWTIRTQWQVLFPR